MRKLLLTTVAAAALVGYAASAPAQTVQTTGPGAGTAAKSENTKPAESKGALSGALKGDVTGGAHAQSPESKKSMQGDSPDSKPQ